MKPASIEASSLHKGQSIPADLAWEHYVNRKPDRLRAWIDEFGDEATARAARLSYVLLQVRDWLEHDRRELELPPLVMNTTRGSAARSLLRCQ